MAGKGEYRNPNMIIRYADPEDETKLYEPDWSKWQNAPLHDQPETDFGQVGPGADISDGEYEDEEKLDKVDKDDEGVGRGEEKVRKLVDKHVAVVK